MNKQYWSETKIATSHTAAEAKDEFERGCDMFLLHGHCNMKCQFCIMQKTYNNTLKYLSTTKTTNIVINGGNVTINIK